MLVTQLSLILAQVYRMAEADIGCSLAEAAESQSYTSYLEEAASRGGPALHVVYINTSLRTKAHAHAIVPTITCTSGNVVQTILQVCSGIFCKPAPSQPFCSYLRIEPSAPLSLFACSTHAYNKPPCIFRLSVG